MKGVIDNIIKSILQIKKETPVIICIDGVDGAGKSEFAKGLTVELELINKKTVLCSVDNFHNSNEIRYQKGKDSAVGFYEDSYNYAGLIANVLEPFKKGEGTFTDSIFDLDLNKPTIFSSKKVCPQSILIVEGIFLQRPELVAYWDLKIFLDVDFKITLERILKRDKDIKKNGSEDQIKHKYTTRYIPGQKIYFHIAAPKEKADIVIDNSDFNNPIILKQNPSK